MDLERIGLRTECTHSERILNASERCHSECRAVMHDEYLGKGKTSKKAKLTLFSDHKGSFLRRQPRAMTTGHSQKQKGTLNLRWIWPVLSALVCPLPLKLFKLHS